MTYILLPLINTGDNGQRYQTHAYSHLKWYYSQMIYDGILEHAFYDGSARTYDQFHSLVSYVGVTFLFAYSLSDANRPVGHCYLTNMHGYCSVVHFGILKDSMKDAEQIMLRGLNTIFSVKRDDGTPFATTLLGLTPKYNRAARAISKKVGFRHLTFINDSCYLFYKSRFCSGELQKVIPEWVGQTLY